jgi:hypothetical protein
MNRISVKTSGLQRFDRGQRHRIASRAVVSRGDDINVPIRQCATESVDFAFDFDRWRSVISFHRGSFKLIRNSALF